MERGDNESFPSEGISDRGSIITARGTGDGLIIRLDGRAGQESIREAFHEFMSSRRRFVSGNDVSFEWVGSMPESAFVEELSSIAQADYDINVRSSTLREAKARAPKETGAGSLRDAIERERVVDAGVSSSIRDSRGKKSTPGTAEDLGLFGGIDAFPFEDEVKRTFKSGGDSRAPVDTNLWDNADARLVFSTVRSGQKIETEHSLIVVGDVNSGAELIAGGDIIVLGTLRGVAHAGAYDETGGGRIIFGLNLQPTQLRIGMVISRGGASDGARGSEIARVDGGMIVVEPYQAKATLSRRRD